MYTNHNSLLHNLKVSENMRIDHQNGQVAPISVYIDIFIGRCLGALLRSSFSSGLFKRGIKTPAYPGHIVG